MLRGSDARPRRSWVWGGHRQVVCGSFSCVETSKVRATSDSFQISHYCVVRLIDRAGTWYTCA